MEANNIPSFKKWLDVHKVKPQISNGTITWEGIHANGTFEIKKKKTLYNLSFLQSNSIKRFLQKHSQCTIKTFEKEVKNSYVAKTKKQTKNKNKIPLRGWGSI